MLELYCKYNDELKGIAESFFNEISANLLKKIYILNLTNFISSKEEQNQNLNFFNTHRIRTLSKRDENWINLCNKEFGLGDVQKDLENATFFESPVIVSDIDTISFYKIYLFLNIQDIDNNINPDFLKILANSFLFYYSKELQYDKKLENLKTSKVHIYIDAGKRYFEDISKKLNPNNINSFLFQNLIEVSTFRYETSETKGKILLGNMSTKSDVFFSEPLSLSKDSKMVRKAVQLTNEKSYLICDSSSIIGIHYINGKIKYENYYSIRFNGYNSFALYQGLEQLILEIKDGIPFFPIEKKDWEVDLDQAILSKFPDTKDNLIEKIKEVHSYQSHGAVIVITDKAKTEAERFSNLSIQIKNPDNTIKKSRIQSFGDIDGAIILDENAKCHALGVILDGSHLRNSKKVSKKRGARYNSSLRYFESQKINSKIIVVIMSEDGDVDILY